MRRRRLMLLISTALTGVAGVAGQAGAAPPPLAILALVPGLSKTRRPVKPFAILDYRNNPFLTPIGKPFTAAERRRPTPGAVIGHGVNQ
jgi:hypothetical protein